MSIARFLKTFSIALTFTVIAVHQIKADTPDCFESVNRAIFGFNVKLDKIVFKPIAKGYSYLPDSVETSLGNATSNVSHLVAIPNQLLQGKLGGAIHDTGRFLINTTVGILGLFDPASKIGLEKQEPEDYGQTLGYWGVGHGCYVVLPVLGPTTLRDGLGNIGNTYLDPFYLSTVGDKEYLLDNNLGDRTYWTVEGVDKVNWRAENLQTVDDLEKNSVDFYSSVKSIYLQRRNKLTKDGDLSDEDEWKDFN